MSDEEEEVVIVPVPKHRIRFSDMPWANQEKAIRLINDMAQKHKLDKDLSTAIKLDLDKDPLLQDDCGGWHGVGVGAGCWICERFSSR